MLYEVITIWVMAWAVGVPCFVMVCMAAKISSKAILFEAASGATWAIVEASSPNVVFPRSTVLNMTSATFSVSPTESPQALIV